MGSGFGTVRGYCVSVDNYSFIDNIHAESGKLFLSVRSLKMICCGFSAFEYAAFSKRKSACAYCGYRLVLTVEAADKLRKSFAGGYAYGTAKIIFAQPITSAKALNAIVSKPLAHNSSMVILCTSILHSSLVVYNTVIILFPSGIVKQTAGIIRVKKQAVCELFVKIRKSSEKGLTK